VTSAIRIGDIVKCGKMLIPLAIDAGGLAGQVRGGDSGEMTRLSVTVSDQQPQPEKMLQTIVKQLDFLILPVLGGEW